MKLPEGLGRWMGQTLLLACVAVLVMYFFNRFQFGLGIKNFLSGFFGNGGTRIGEELEDAVANQGNDVATYDPGLSAGGTCPTAQEMGIINEEGQYQDTWLDCLDFWSEGYTNDGEDPTSCATPGYMANNYCVDPSTGFDQNSCGLSVLALRERIFVGWGSSYPEYEDPWRYDDVIDPYPGGTGPSAATEQIEWLISRSSMDGSLLALATEIATRKASDANMTLDQYLNQYGGLKYWMFIGPSHSGCTITGPLTYSE